MTGKRILKHCKRCNKETERYESGGCKVCVRDDRQKHRAENKDTEKAKSRERAAAWRKLNPEKAKQRRDEFYKKHSEKIKANAAAAYAADPDKFRARAKAKNLANPDMQRNASAKWKSNNKDACRAQDNNRRAKKIANGGRLSKCIVEKLMKLQRRKCACCGLPLGDNFHIDHIMPLARGGPNTDQNAQLLHSKCNLQKSAKHPVDFMQQRGYLI